jgi:hypothetical protein
MPWHQKTMKDVVSCDKLRVVANTHLSGDFRMGQPSPGNAGLLESEYIGLQSETRGSETSQYPEEEKSTEIPLVAASESGTAQTSQLADWGCGT